jgi:hypothetical protein
VYTGSIGENDMYTWRVWKDNRFAGYVESLSETGAYLAAQMKFGQNILIERAWKSGDIVLSKR